MAISKYGDIGVRTAAWAAKEKLKHAEPHLVLQKFGLTKPIPKNSTKTIKFRRCVPFPVDEAALTLVEGVTPNAQDIRYEDVEATLSQYGAYAEITDDVQDLSEDPVLADASMLCGEQAGELTEQVVWGILRAGTSVFYSGGVSSRSAVNTAIDRSLQRNITRSLKRNKAKKVTKVIGASEKYATEPVAPAYIAFAHTDMESDIRDMDGFVPTEKYGNMKALPYEIGKVEDVRYILTPSLGFFAGAGASNKDVYPVIYIGAEAYGVTPLKGANAIEPKVLNPNVPRGGDPLGQRGSVGWKTRFKAVRLNELWMARAEVTLSE